MQQAVSVLEFDEETKLVKKKMFVIPGFARLTDFAATKNWYIFHQPPVDQRPDSKSMMLPSDVRDKDPLKIYFVPRGRESGNVEAEVDVNVVAEVLEVDRQFPLQSGNAYEEVIMCCVCVFVFLVVPCCDQIRLFFGSVLIYSTLLYSTLL